MAEDIAPSHGAPEPPGDGPHGSHMPAFLKRKYGPLSGWAWALIAAVGIGFIILVRKRRSGGSSQAASAPVGTPVGSGATGFTQDQLGQLQGIVNGSVASAYANNAPGGGTASSTGPTTNPLAQYVNSEYTNLLGRSGDTSGVTYWTNQLLGGQTTQQQFTAFEGTQEAANYAQTNPTGFITGQYETLLNRQPDAAGLAYWQSYLQTHGVTNESATFLQAAQPEINAQH